MQLPKLQADQEGVWRDDGEGKPWGIPWTEVCKVEVCCVDTITRNNLVLTLDWEYGEFVELDDEWPGFLDVAMAISLRLPGVDPEWISHTKKLAPGESLQVWKRP